MNHRIKHALLLTAVVLTVGHLRASAASNNTVHLVSQTQTFVSSVDWGANNKIAVGYGSNPDSSKMVQIFDAQGHLITSIETSQVETVAWSPKPNDDRLLVAPLYGEVAIYNGSTGQLVQLLHVDQYGGSAGAAWSSDGTKVIGTVNPDNASEHKTLYVWDAATGTVLSTITILPDLDHYDQGVHLNAVAWRPGSNQVASGLTVQGIIIWDALSGTQIKAIPINKGSTSLNTSITPTDYSTLDSVSGISWSPDGNRLAVSLGEGIKIWNANTYQLEFTLPRGNTLRWSPDGSRLATISVSDIKIFNAITGAEISHISSRNQKYEFANAGWSPNGQSLLYGQDNIGTANVTIASAITTAPPAPMQPLKLTATCSSNPSDHRVWRINNPNPFDVPFTWSVNTTNQSGSGVARASGDVTFQTNTASNGSNIANTAHLLVNGVQQDTKAAVASQCQTADLGLAMSIDNPTPTEGETITYTLTYTNAGPGTATDVRIAFPLPQGVSFLSVSGSGTGEYDAVNQQWLINDVPKGQSTKLSLQGVVNLGTAGQTITATASISAESTDPNPANNTASTQFTAAPAPTVSP